MCQQGGGGGGDGGGGGGCGCGCGIRALEFVGQNGDVKIFAHLYI